VVLYGGDPDVNLFTTGKSPRYLRSYSRSLIDPTANEKILLHLHGTYGVSLRSLFLFAHKPADYEEEVDRDLRGVSPQKLDRLIRSAAGGFRYLTSAGPSQTSRTRSEKTIASQCILEKICKLVLRDRVEEIRKIYDMSLGNSSIPTAAGMIFEYRVHQLLQQGTVMNLFPIIGKTEQTNVIYEDYTATDSRAAAVRITLPKLAEIILEGEMGSTLQVGDYYRPRNKNFPPLDSWLLAQPTSQESPILLRFQITHREARYGAEISGLAKVDKLVTAGTQKCLVVVTPTGVRPKVTVSRDYLTDTFLAGRDPNVAFPVYHLPYSYDALF
jgi:hypothetical protein